MLTISIQVLLIAVVFIAAIIAGIVLRKLTKEELKDGKKWFLVVIAVSLISIIALLIFYRNWAMILTLILIAVVSYISWRK